MKKGTGKKHKTTLIRLKKFSALKKKPSFSFSEIDYSFVKDFDQYLRIDGLAVNTLHSHHKNIKKYFNEACKRGLTDERKSPYKVFKAKTEKTSRVILTEKELQKIIELNLEEETTSISMVRDAFVFACYTGLRYSDLVQCPAKNFRNTNKGLELYLSAQKTGKDITIPLYLLHGGKPQALIYKYLDKAHDPEKALFFGTNQFMNRELKIIAQKAGIRFRLTMHVARHTFATHMASKVPVHVLQHLLQHSKVETTMIYVHMSETVMHQSLEKINWD